MSEFVHYKKKETIAAIATPAGTGGVAIIRISGSEAEEIANHLFSKEVSSLPSHQMHYGWVRDGAGNPIDKGLLVVMRAPRSFTGENVVEIHCHGGALITKRVLEVTLAAGARAALPGEFSFQAFMNGKIDLTQAEALQEFIGAKNQTALHLAQQQLEGKLSQEVHRLQKELTAVAAIFEAWIDFPEEGLEVAAKEEVLTTLRALHARLKTLADTFEDGRRAREGITLCLAGPPNVGKSSLMNALLGKERAIVTQIAGTTRDLLEEELLIGGVHFCLTDTAGIHNAAEIIEQEGIRRARLAMERADLILLVLDATRPDLPEGLALWQQAPKEKTLLIWNKTDVASPPTSPPGFSLSAKTTQGIDALKKALHRRALGETSFSKEEIIITQVRHAQALQASAGHLHTLIEALSSDLSPEFLTLDLYEALQNLGLIIGTNITEDILSSIFSTFCVGK